jgi:hypothetical protein
MYLRGKCSDAALSFSDDPGLSSAQIILIRRPGITTILQMEDGPIRHRPIAVARRFVNIILCRREMPP